MYKLGYVITIFWYIFLLVRVFCGKEIITENCDYVSLFTWTVIIFL